MAKTKAHLYYSQSCRTRLLSQNMQCMPAAGTGSSEDRVREQLHDFLLPPLKGYGPHLPCSRRRDMVPIDDRLHLKLVDLVAEQTVVADFGDALQAHAEEHPISWTTWKATLHFFIDTFAEDDAIMFDYDIAELLAVLRGLASAEAWPFLRTLSSSRPTSTFRSVAECHEWCALTIADVSQLQPVPRQFGRHRYILHAFSGRRRIGDLQYFLERIVQHKQAYVVHVISLDIIVSSTWGDISQDHVRQFWLNAIRAQWVFAFIGGPPCETWSRVRAVGHESMPKSGRHVPRVLRDLRDLWGFESVAVRELQQLLIGNCLLGFAIEAMFEIALAQGIGVLEHSAEPDDLPEAASIWRLPLLQLLLNMPGASRCRFAQGMLGAPTPKPTDFLLINLADMILHLHQHRIRAELPHARAVGCTVDGHWRTSVLKEYPPALCKAVAQAFLQRLDECPIDSAASVPPHNFQDICSTKECTVYSSILGRDFAGS